ncbi:DNA polymerase III subunit psi [Legionella sp. W05-934-2]|jgi:DNA polymerase III psi subunit|uniref:DNA polymerase III subunit psi n=1 Tax=Legionella sp. W05-934-2 TaxID=1198649 RepID=UPI0034627F6A
MDSRRGYYLQQMGITVWQQRKKNVISPCQCNIANHNLDQATLLCCLENELTKSEKDLWVFMSMAFDFSQKYYQIVPPIESSENTVCPACIDNWLNQSIHHHAIIFGHGKFIEDIAHKKNWLFVPSLMDMIANPTLKKQCFKDIQHFLCQEHLVI